MKKLADLAKKSVLVDFFEVYNGHHNDTWHVAGRGYYKRLKKFIANAFSGSGACFANKSTDSIDELDASIYATSSVGAAIPTMKRGFGVE
jgi:hypothetical protein